MEHYIVVLHLLWSAVLSLYRAEACTDIGISYDEVPAKEYGQSAFLQCTNTASLKWWRASSECGPFERAHSCGTSQVCAVSINDTNLQRNFYYCCTSGDVPDMSDIRDVETVKTCYHINICTEITTTQADTDLTIGFFGQLLPVYIKLYAEPAPRLESHALRLLYNDTHQSQSLEPQSVYQHSAVDSSLLVWVFYVLVPQVESVEYGTLRLTVFFSTVDSESCASTRSGTFDVGLARGDVIISPPDVTTGPPATDAPTIVSSTNATVISTPTEDSLSSAGCVAWIVPFAIFLVTTLVLAVTTVVACVCLCVQVSRKQSVHSLSNHSNHCNGVNGVQRQRPGTLTYNMLQTSSSVTPTPIVNGNGKSVELHAHFSPALPPFKTTAEAINPHAHSPNDSGHYEEIPGQLANKCEDSSVTYSSEYISGSKVGELCKDMESPKDTVV